jgi:carbonic anhydrase/acetyltransferase-like protein (isoleucine patch superfamily)
MDFSSLVVPTAGHIKHFQLTPHGVLISKIAMIKYSANIRLGKGIIGESTVLRGDLGVIQASDYVIFGDRVVIHPSYQKKKTSLKFTGIKIESYTLIGNDTVVKAAKIGRCVRIGRNCVIVSIFIFANYF